MNELNEYEFKIKNDKKLSDLQKEQYLQNAENQFSKGFPIILNTYHFSNIIGVKWEIIKRLINNGCKNYHKFNITKKDGISKREILAPSSELKFVQNQIKKLILEKVSISDNCFGFVKDKNIVKNAEVHLNSEMILNIDLKDFFPSINAGRVYYIFSRICGYDKDLSYCLTKLVTYKNYLPQGAPTSPMISNIVGYMLDIRLAGLANCIGIKYTRYADDITFSGTRDKINNSLLILVKKIIDEEGFTLNNNKVHFSTSSQRQEVTGLIINNNKISVGRKYIRKIKQELYYIEHFGLNNHIKNSNIKNAFYVEHLKGKIMFVRSVDLEKGNLLLNKYNELELDKY